MKHLLLIGCGFLAAVMLFAAAMIYGRLPQKPPAIVVTSQGPTVERLEKLSQLVTMRVYVADVLTAEGEGYRGAWLIRGDALIGVTLGNARILEKDEQARRATVLLPRPTVVQSRVDHERTSTWEVKKTAWVPWSGGDESKLRDSVMIHAQRLVAHAANSEENMRQAKAGAEAVLRSFFDELGWRVQVSWEEAPASPAAPNPSPGADRGSGE